jgi:DNA primase
MVSPDADGRSRDRIVIPFTHNDTIVGSTSHYIDGKTPKYINDMQTGYVFGIDLQQVGWQHLIVVEGVFDALSINACAVLHNDINSQQVQVIKALQRSVTVVPDLDKAGMNLVDRAVELGWAVSIPDWPDSDIKDVNDAVKRYGKLATLMLIMRYRETSKIKIELRKKQIGKRL